MRIYAYNIYIYIYIYIIFLNQKRPTRVIKGLDEYPSSEYLKRMYLLAEDVVVVAVGLRAGEEPLAELVPSTRQKHARNRVVK
jgi:hypothetical protein